jgi:Trk K+ transport system NAD-binding subunit
VTRFEDIDIDAIELTVSPDCKYLRKRYTLEQLTEDYCIGVISRNNQLIIPNTHSEIRAGDQLLVIIKEENISKAERLFQ